MLEIIYVKENVCLKKKKKSSNILSGKKNLFQTSLKANPPHPSQIKTEMVSHYKMQTNQKHNTQMPL